LIETVTATSRTRRFFGSQRLRRATTIEPGMFEIEVDDLSGSDIKAS
jgi:hypothetical protein